MNTPPSDIFHRDLMIIAHRGASGVAPENTFSAFEKAVALRADMIELDIQLTQDGHWIVMHDLSLKRTCGIRKPVRDLPLSKMKNLDAGSWFSKDFSAEKIPVLDELLSWAKNKVSLNIEIKGKINLKGKSVDSLLKTISDHGMKKEVLLSSFNWKILRVVRNLDRDIPIGLLVNRELRSRYLKEALRLNAISIHLPKHKIRKGLPERIHALKMRVLVYTLNSLEEMERCTSVGIDGFFTNYPGLPPQKALPAKKH
jgi:glycerophosphoryl diester phosphodiesterase